MSNITTRALGQADAALIAAEQQIAALRQAQAALRAAGDHGDHDELSTPLFALVTRIAKTAPDSLIGAAVKLRMLADENIGIEAGSNGDGDVESVRQILAAGFPAKQNAAAGGCLSPPEGCAGCVGD